MYVRSKGFTLVELLAVLVILAVILVIAVPKVMDIIKDVRISTLESTAKLVALSAEKKKVENDIIGNNEILTCENVVKINDIDYESCYIEFIDNKAVVTIIGSGTFKGMNACEATKTNANVTERCLNKKVEVTLELNGGSATDISGIYKEGTIIDLEEPVKENSTFTSYEIVSGNSVITNNKLTVGSTNTIIHAVYETWPSLEIDLDGGNDNTDYNEKYKSGSIIELEVPIKTGYIFTGWTKESGNSVLSRNTLTMGSEDTKVKALWIINTYNINYELDGGSFDEVASTNGVYESTIKLTTPTKEGYTFIKWEIIEGEGILNDNVLIVGSSDVVLKALWKINYYNLTYNYNLSSIYKDGEFDNTGYVVNWDEDFTITEKIRISSTGQRYLIIGSYDQSDKNALNIEITVDGALRVYFGIGGHEFLDGNVTPNEDITVVFRWDSLASKYTITAKGNTTNISFNGTYEISGKSRNALRLGTEDWRGKSVFGNIMVYSLSILDKKLNDGTSKIIPTPVRKGYEFSGWNISSGNSTINENTITIKSDSTILKANWQNYNVIYNYNLNSTFVSNKSSDTGYTINWDEDFTIIEKIKIYSTEKRYLIIGNYDNSDKNALNIEFNKENQLRIYIGTGEYEFLDGVVTPNEDILVIFSWDALADKYTITAKGNTTDISLNGTYEMNGKSRNTLKLGTEDWRGESVFEKISVYSLNILNKKINSSALEKKPIPLREGYIFSGWQVEGGNVNTNENTFTMNNENVLLNAKWVLES